MKAKIEILRDEIRKHEKAYYNARPIISDREFDELMSELQRLEDDDPALITPDSPTQVIYYEE